MRPMHNSPRRGNGGGNNRYNNNRTNYAGNRSTGSSSGGNRPMNRNHSFDSVNPGGGRLRGTAQQLSEKYAELARANAASGDSTLAENQLQHAEHYARVNSEILEAMGFSQQQQREQQQAASAEFGTDTAPPELTAYPPPATPAPQMPMEQPSLGDFEPPEFLRART